jgi:sigma-B regulation protein RsbU (phosphoserine phosphatase)
MIRALIVDDEAPARDRLRRLLSPGDVTVVGEAENGAEAIARIAALQPDLVFLDIQMPALSGLEVAARLPAPRPRIVFCTAYDRFAVEAFELHAVDYLLKPVHRDRLMTAVNRIAGEIAEQRHRTRERDDAVRTQRRLMPETAPEQSGLDCAGVCIPAEGVGGDYYDFLPMEGGRLGLVVGDVSGKGVYAGLLAAALQARLQAITSRATGTSGSVIGELNRLTAGTIEANRFATVFFGAFDRTASTLTYVNAGHPAAVVVADDGNTTTLDATGSAVGWTSDAHFAERTIAFSAGDVVAIYSDGISEAAAPDGRDFGVEGVARTLRRHRSSHSSEIITALCAEVDRFTVGAAASDDRTVLVAKVDR